MDDLDSETSSRTVQACLTCRKRKTKCDGARPSCRYCSLKKASCRWPGQVRALPPTTLDVTGHGLRLPADRLGPDHLELTEEALSWCLSLFYERHLPFEMCSFLYKPDFERSLTEHKFLESAVVALCARYISDTENQRLFSGINKERVVSTFTRHAARHARDSVDQPSVLNIQANLILCMADFLSNTGTSHWMYAGTAIRMAQLMRLNKEYHQKHSFREREIRRRTFWACLTVDRLLGFYLIRPQTLSIRNVAVWLPSSSTALAYGEDSRQMTLAGLETFQGNLSDIGILPYLIKATYLWADLADLHIHRDRVVSRLPPTDPSSSFALCTTNLENWVSRLPDRLQWSENNLRLHCDLKQEAEFILIQCITAAAFCVLHQNYLPQTDGTSILLDYADGAGWSFLHRDERIISTCLSHALRMGEVLSSAVEAGHDLNPSVLLAACILSTINTLLWIRHNPNVGVYESHKDAALKLVQMYEELLRSWADSCSMATEWIRQLRDMRTLYRYAYTTQPEISETTDVSRNSSPPPAQESTQYRPQPGDGGPLYTSPGTLPELLIRSRISPLDARKEYEESVWIALMHGMRHQPGDDLLFAAEVDPVLYSPMRDPNI